MPSEPATVRDDLDPRAVQRLLARVAGAPEPPWLHGEVARRMAQRLPLILRTPHTVLQWSGHAAASDALLAAAYPKAQRLVVEPGPSRDRPRRAPWWSRRRWSGPAPATVIEGEPPPAAAQLLWSNLLLHVAADPAALFARWKRALADDGFVMFSTFGPDTLAELRAVYAEQGWPPPGPAFVDMHDLGDMLVGAGFADPVVDQETLVLTWPDGEALLRELRSLGANVHPRRAAGLRTPRWKQRLVEALQKRADAQGRIALHFEIVYGHAFNAPPRVPVAARTEVEVDDLRRMARAGRRPGAI